METILFTWNHEAFIDVAMASWESQDLEESSSLVVHDDASTDSTLDIVLGRIHGTAKPVTVISREKNQFAQSRFMFVPHIYSASKAKYIAVLDGDDFWCSKAKLRLTTEALEKNPLASLVFHDFFIPLRSIPLISIRSPSGIGEKIISTVSLMSENPIGALTAVFRVESLPKKVPSGFSELRIADLPIWIFLAHEGDVIYLRKTLAIYRLHANNYFANQKRASQQSAHEQAAYFAAEFLGIPAPIGLRSRQVSFGNHLMRLRLTPPLWLAAMRYRLR